jgi:hypothetical protein
MSSAEGTIAFRRSGHDVLSELLISGPPDRHSHMVINQTISGSQKELSRQAS